MKKRLLSILLAAVILLTMLPLGLVDTAYAASSGTCGDKLTWKLSDDGTLTISGTGDMKTYNIYNYGYAPWYDLRSQVKSVVIERGVTSIGDGAFYYCDALTNVTIPSSVTSIGSSAFESCTSLTSVTIPNGVTSIGDYAFSFCDSLTSVTIPSSVTTIGYGAFGGYSALTDIYYGGYGIGWLKAGGGNDRAPKNATVHFKDDLYGKGSCGENVNWVMTAGGTLTISGTGRMNNYDYDSRPWYICQGYVKSVVIESGVTSIGDYAFSVCDSLTSVTIPSSVTTIGDHAFICCSSLTSVTIPDNVTTIGDYAFYECYALASVTIPISVTTIGDQVFKDCKALTNVTIPSSVTKIGNNAFWGSGVAVNVVSGNKNYSSENGVLYNKQKTALIYGGTCKGTFKIPNSVTSICSDAFFNCTSLTSVTIPDSVTTIGGYAFGWCRALTSVIIPNSVVYIGHSTFYGCESLTSVTIPDSVTSIAWDTFFDCTSLTSVTIPNSVTSIGEGAFYNCSSLTSVTIPSSVTEIGCRAFADSDAAVNVASGNKNYCSEDGVLYNKEKTVLLYGGACKGTFKIPNSVTSIDENAFSGCESLMGITIPKSVTTIGQYAFLSCWGLTDITLPSSMTEIEEGVLSGCTNLTSITIPHSVTNIGRSAFFFCDRLTDVYYDGTAADWEKVTIENDGNENLTSATLHCAPAAPVVTAGNSAVSGKPMLTWNAVEGATSYRIYRSTAKGSGYSLLGTTTATSYTNTGAKAGTTYYYRVKAVNDAGLSPYSNIVSGQVKTVAQQKPAAPVVKIGNSASSGKPMLTWNAVSGATSYKVYRATSQNGTYSLLGTVTATSYTNTGAKAGTTYYYKVKAVNSAGESAYSNIVSGQAMVTVLTMGHSASSGKPQLTWKAVSGAASYKVYRATSKTGAYSVINTTSALTYTNTGAALGTTYYYKVEALNSAGKSMGFSAIVEGKVAPVLAVGYSSVSGKPQLTWKAVPGATEYQVYRSTQQNSGYAKINTTTATSYVNTGAKANTTYYYKIVAVKNTAASGFSNIVTARPSK